MSETDLLQFRVNRDLLNPNFEGYKLCLDSIPTKSLKLPHALYKPQIKQSQYSLLHQHLFFTHNFLTYDDWASANNDNVIQAYAVLEDQGVYCMTFFKNTSKFDIHKVFEINLPSPKDGEQECYNATISLPSPHFALVSNGHSSLWLCDRRNKSFHPVFSTSTLLSDKAFAIVDSVEKTVGQENQLVFECLVKTVVESESKAGSFTNQFLWLTLGYDKNGEWQLCRTRKIDVRSVVNYCSLSRSNTVSSVCVLSSATVRFVEDSAKPVQKPESDIKNGSRAKVYEWRQNDDEIVVRAEIAKNVTKSTVEFSLSSDRIDVSVDGTKKSIINGALFAQVDANASRWSIGHDGQLEIRLVKRDKGVSWTEVVKGDSSGQYIPEPELTRTMSDRLVDFTTEQEAAEPFSSRPAFNAEDIEECDAVPIDALCLTWLDGESHQVLRTVDMGGHQWLFSARIRPDEPPYLGMRFDVDGILWRVPSDPLEKVTPTQTPGGALTPLSAHSVTFDAFGYVEAAKESRQLVSCSPSAIYAVIADQRRNIYIYWRNRNVSGELKNRKTGKVVQTVCKQTLLTVDADQEILGLSALDDCLIVLTDTHLHVFTFSFPDVC